MTTLNEAVTALQDYLEEESEKSGRLANIGAAIIWMAREHVQAHATPEIRQYFENAVAQFLPVCHDVMSVDPVSDGSMVPDFSPTDEPGLVESWLAEDFSTTKSR